MCCPSIQASRYATKYHQNPICPEKQAPHIPSGFASHPRPFAAILSSIEYQASKIIPGAVSTPKNTHAETDTPKHSAIIVSMTGLPLVPTANSSRSIPRKLS